MGRGPHWGADEIEHVKQLMAENKGASKIARATQRSVNSVQKLLGRLRKGLDPLEVKPRGRARALNPRQREQLQKWVQDHPADSIANVRARMVQMWGAEGDGDGSAGPSRSTFSREMAGTTRPLKPTRVQKLSDTNRLKRYQFCTKVLARLSIGGRSRIRKKLKRLTTGQLVFCDEKIFRLQLMNVNAQNRRVRVPHGLPKRDAARVMP